MMKNKITRFSFCERCFHNTVMVTFTILLASGLAMLYFNSFGEQTGTREIISLAHLAVSVAFIVGPIMIFLMGARKEWRENVRVLTSWGRADFVWLLKKPFTLFSKKISLPKADKFNPGQKSWALVAMGSSAILIVTGIYIWMYSTALLAVFIHSAVAILMTVALGGHLFMALINPATRPGFRSIVDGKVDKEWVAHHHPIWYRRNTCDAQGVNASFHAKGEANSGIAGFTTKHAANDFVDHGRSEGQKVYQNG